MRGVFHHQYRSLYDIIFILSVTLIFQQNNLSALQNSDVRKGEEYTSSFNLHISVMRRVRWIKQTVLSNFH